MNSSLSHAIKTLTENLEQFVSPDDEPVMYNMNQALRGIAEGVAAVEDRLQQLEAIVRSNKARA